jgi:transcriptional regulator with XRE-family HTH domain
MEPTEAELRRRYISALRRERLRANLSLTDLAGLLALSVSAVSQWERGVKFPSPYHRRRLLLLMPRLANAWEEEATDGDNPDRRTRPGPEGTSPPA